MKIFKISAGMQNNPNRKRQEASDEQHKAFVSENLPI
jgi:hypothetical protein